MKVDVFTPEDNVGDVIGDLNRRRGMIKSQDAGVRVCASRRMRPLAEMFGYIGHLRTLTSGRGQFSMEFSHYAPCPQAFYSNLVNNPPAGVRSKSLILDSARSSILSAA